MEEDMKTDTSDTRNNCVQENFGQDYGTWDRIS